MDLKLDPHNANRGTTRGGALLKESLATCGVGRGVVADRHGTLVAGNKTFAAAQALGIPTDLVETTGHELVVVQRDDLDLATDPKARQLAYYDNRVGELDLSWSAEQVQADVLAGVAVDALFFPDELQRLALLDDAVAMNLPATDGGTVLSEAEDTEPSPTPVAASLTVVLTFATIEQQLQWRAFQDALRTAYPDVPTAGARLAAHLAAIGIA